MTAIYQAEAVSRTFLRGEERVRALDCVSFSIGEGEMVAVTGPSGSGKTTLLQTLGLLDPGFSGELQLCGQRVSATSSQQRAALRLAMIGFVFQGFYLLPALDVRDNVALPRWRLKGDRRAARRQAEQLLDEVGLSGRLHHRPQTLSAGEIQRVSLARALVNDPRVVLADEPTGNLDGDNTRAIIDLLARIHARGKTLVLVSHDHEVVRAAQRVLTLRYGRLEGDLPACEVQSS